MVKIHSYMIGFRSVTVKVQKHNAKEGKYIEITWPDYHFKKIARKKKEEVMLFLLKSYRSRQNPPKIEKNLKEYETHLIQNYPEMLL